MWANMFSITKKGQTCNTEVQNLIYNYWKRIGNT